MPSVTSSCLTRLLQISPPENTTDRNNFQLAFFVTVVFRTYVKPIFILNFILSDVSERNWRRRTRNKKAILVIYQ